MADPFDPDAYLTQHAAGFDPDAYLKQAAQPPAASGPSQAQSALHGAGQSVSMGFGDELTGASAAAAAKLSQLTDYLARTAPGRAVTRALIGGAAAGMPDALIDQAGQAAREKSRRDVLGGNTPGEAYDAMRDFARAQDRATEKANPKSFYGGMVGGAVLAPPVFKAPAMPNTLRVLGKAIPRATPGGSFAVNALPAAGNAALSGAGASESETLGGVVADAAKAAPLGAAIGGTIGAGLERGVPWVQEATKGLAEDMALRAVGVRAGISNILRSMGYGTAEEGRELGRAALDEGVIPVFGKAEDVRRNAETLIPQRHAVSQGLLEQAEDAAARARENHALSREGVGRAAENIRNQPLFNWWRATGGARDALREGQDLGLTATAQRGTRSAQRFASDIESEATRASENPAGFGFLRANKLKQDMQKGINYGQNSTSLSIEADRRVAASLRKSIEDQAAEALQDPTAAQALRTANKRTGQLIDIEKLAANRATEQLSHDKFGKMSMMLTPIGAGAMGGLGYLAGGNAGAAVGSALGAVPGVLGSFLQPYLPGFAARSLDATQKGLYRAIPHAANAASSVSQFFTNPVSQAATRPEPEEADRKAFVKGNGG